MQGEVLCNIVHVVCNAESVTVHFILLCAILLFYLLKWTQVFFCDFYDMHTFACAHKYLKFGYTDNLADFFVYIY